MHYLPAPVPALLEHALLCPRCFRGSLFVVVKDSFESGWALHQTTAAAGVWFSSPIRPVCPVCFKETLFALILCASLYVGALALVCCCWYHRYGSEKGRSCLLLSAAKTFLNLAVFSCCHNLHIQYVLTLSLFNIGWSYSKTRAWKVCISSRNSNWSM